MDRIIVLAEAKGSAGVADSTVRWPLDRNLGLSPNSMISRDIQLQRSPKVEMLVPPILPDSLHGDAA
jgi:hypothetical protein